jgi:hypothetical protein
MVEPRKVLFHSCRVVHERESGSTSYVGGEKLVTRAGDNDCEQGIAYYWVKCLAQMGFHVGFNAVLL